MSVFSVPPGDWFPWTGGPPPFTGTHKVKVRLRCQSRGEAEAKEPREVKFWRRWTHDGGPGDIVEVMEIV